MPKMTFIINSLSSGGAEKVMSVLLTELVRQSYNVELICLEKNNFYTISKEVKVTYLSDNNGSESGIKKLFSIPFLAWKLKKHIRQNNILLAQSHVYRANYINVLATLFGANHQAQVVNAGRVSRYLEQGLLGKANLFLIKHLYSKATLIVSKSQGMQLDMQELFHFDNAQVVINNPYEIVKIQQRAKEVVTDFNFNTNKTYLISVGRLIALKRNEDTIEALSQLPEHVELILLGEGDQTSRLKQITREHNLENRVHFLGRVTNPYQYIKRADIFVSASESEGFPNVLVESMICGTPVVSSDCTSGPREILAADTDVKVQLKDSMELTKYGILFPIGDVANLHKAIGLLLEDDNIVTNCVNHAKKRAEDFTLEKIVGQYKKVLGVE